MLYEIRQTQAFTQWVKRLKDKRNKNRILARIHRLENGQFGDCKNIDTLISELRLFFGPGYRIYYTIKNNTLILLLCGGDKRTQSRDIEKARKLLEEIES